MRGTTSSAPNIHSLGTLLHRVNHPSRVRLGSILFFGIFPLFIMDSYLRTISWELCARSKYDTHINTPCYNGDIRYLRSPHTVRLGGRCSNLIKVSAE